MLMLFPKFENSKIYKLTIKYLLPLWFPWVWYGLLIY